MSKTASQKASKVGFEPQVCLPQASLLEETPDVSSQVSSTSPTSGGTMKGLWSLSVHLLGHSFHDQYAVARISLDIVFLCVIIYARTWQPTAHKFKKSFDGIRYGTDVLLLWV
jgi:hypothetical protein